MKPNPFLVPLATIIAFLALTVLFPQPLAPYSPSSGQPTITSLHAFGPGHIQGYSPNFFDMYGYIVINGGPCSVKYRMILSDGSIGTTLESQYTGSELELHPSIGVASSFSGWAALEILAPEQRVTEHYPCSYDRWPQPNLQQVTWSPTADNSARIEVTGTNLVWSPLSKSTQQLFLFMDASIKATLFNAGVANPNWQPDHIIANVQSIQPWGPIYQFRIKGHEVLVVQPQSNIVSVRFPFQFKIMPTEGKVGDSINMKIPFFPKNPAGLVLKFGPASIDLGAYSAGPDWNVTIKVPALPPSHYELYLMKNGEIASAKGTVFAILPELHKKTP